MTIRTQAELEALYADNAAGNISAQDLRDLVDTLFQPRTVNVHAVQFARTTGPGRPTPGFVGPSNYLQFEINDEAWFHLTLPNEILPSEDILIHVDAAPAGAETGKTMSWELSYVVMDGDGTIGTADDTLTITDNALPSTQWANAEMEFTIPASAVSEGDTEIHMKLKRIASTSDPVTDPSIHHVWAQVQVAFPGAT